MKKVITLTDIAVITRNALEHSDLLDVAKTAYENATEAYEAKVAELKTALKAMQALPKIACLVKATYPEFTELGGQRSKAGKAMYNRVARLAKATGLYEPSPARKEAGKNNAGRNKNIQRGKTANKITSNQPSNPVITTPVGNMELAAGVTEPTKAPKVTAGKEASISVTSKPQSIHIACLADFIKGAWTPTQIADLVAYLS